MRDKGRALLAAAPLLLWLAGESAARLVLGPPYFSRWNVLDRHYADELKPAFEDLGDGRLRLDPRFPSRSELRREKPPGVFRVFVIGGSVALPFRLEEARLGEALALAAPGRKLELVHAGSPGSDAARDARVLAQALDLSADAVLLLTGNNEHYEPLSRPAWAQRALWLARQSYALGLAVRRPPPPPRPEKERIERLRAALEPALASAARRGVPVVLAVPPFDPSFGPAPRSNPERNAALRGLCGPCRLADLERLFAKRDPVDVFDDGCHWRDEYYPLASLELARALAGRGRPERQLARGIAAFRAPPPRPLKRVRRMLAAAALEAASPARRLHDNAPMMLLRARQAWTRLGEGELSCSRLSSMKGDLLAEARASRLYGPYARRLGPLWGRVAAACESLEDRRAGVETAR